MKKHTPGPWHRNGHAIEDGQKLTSIVAWADEENENWRANADLLAAAPELLAVCERFAAEKDDAETWTMLRAAIAKARGES